MVLRKSRNVVVFSVRNADIIDVVAVQGGKVWRQAWKIKTARRLYVHLQKEYGFKKA